MPSATLERTEERTVTNSATLNRQRWEDILAKAGPPDARDEYAKRLNEVSPIE